MEAKVKTVSLPWSEIQMHPLAWNGHLATLFLGDKCGLTLGFSALICPADYNALTLLLQQFALNIASIARGGQLGVAVFGLL